jgi:lysophospholipase L1-like esterase
VAFGDSITAATTETPEDVRWPVLLERGLRERLAPRIVRVVNAGVGGNTSREGLARMDSDVLAHRPDVVLVQFGGNDATPEMDRRVPLDEYARNLAAMQARIETCSHGRMALITFPPVIDHHHVWWYEVFKEIGGQDACVEQYREVTRQFARDRGLPLFDLDSVIRACPDAYILSDGVHLTVAGNRAFAEALLTFLL